MTSPPFDLGLAAVFAVVGEELDLGRAAERLEIDRMAVRADVAALEAQVGAALVRAAADVTIADTGVDGSRTGVPGMEDDALVLTPAGTRFLAVSTEIAARAGMVEAALRAGDGGTLRLAVGFTVRAMAHELVRSFAAASPGTEIRTEEMHGTEAMAALTDRTVDVAFDLPHGIPLGCRYLPIDRVPLVLVAPREHRLAQLEQVRWSDLEGEPVIVAPPGIVDSWNVLVRTALRRAGVTAREMRGPWVAHPQEVVEVVARGDGLLIAESGAFDPWPVELTCTPLLPVQELEGGLAWRTDDPERAVQRFVAWAMSSAPADAPGAAGPGGASAAGLGV